jgi:hypothetical protein
LRFTITNNAAISLTGLTFDHTLPNVPAQGLRFTGAPTFTSCGSPNTTTLGNPPRTIVFTRGEVSAGQICEVEIGVEIPFGNGDPARAYNYRNNPVRLTSNEADPVTAGPVELIVNLTRS